MRLLFGNSEEKLDKKSLYLNIKRIWKYLKQERKWLILYVILTLVNTAFGIIMPLISSKMILYLTDGLFKQLLITAIVIFFIDVIEEFIFSLRSICSNKIEFSTTNRMQVDFAQEFLKLEIKEVDKSSTGTFIERLNDDTSGLGYIFFRLAGGITDLLSKAGVMVTVFILNKIVFSYFLLIALINMILGESENRRRDKFWKKIRKAREEKTSLIGELVRGIRDIKVLNARNVVLDKTKEKITKVTDENYNSRKSNEKYSILSNLYFSASELIFIVLGIYLCDISLMTAPTFLILYNYRSRFAFLFSGITGIIATLREFNLSANRVFSVIYGEGFAKEKFGTRKLKKANGDLRFSNVSFGYLENKEVIKDMNLNIKPNETVGIVGKSGAGKSTLLSLITKLYTVNTGSIQLDGIDINELDESSIRDNVAVITQNPYIFNFSIKENLLLANPNASMKKIREACKIACIDDYFMGLEEKYETKLGEGGLVLSGGQKQRLAIARALLMKTKIILFDEATSALDNETQENIQEAIHNLKGDYTIIIVAHRLSTVIDSDRILVVDKGKIVGDGTHKELINTCDVYKRLYKKESL